MKFEIFFSNSSIEVSILSINYLIFTLFLINDTMIYFLVGVFDLLVLLKNLQINKIIPPKNNFLVLIEDFISSVS